MPRKPEYKPLLYTTTIRNPERFKDFMHILKDSMAGYLIIKQSSCSRENCLRLACIDQ